MPRIFLLLSLSLLLLLLTNCTNTLEIPADTTPVNIRLTLTDFDLTTTPITRTETTTTIPENLNRLSLSVFSGTIDNYTSTPVATFTQKREAPSEATHTGGAVLGSDPTFGNLLLTLAPGTYTLVCILHDVKTGSDAAPATITSPTEATLPGTLARDTYTCVQQVTIATTTTDLALSMGNRINARFRLTITDAAPADVTKLVITINPDAPKATNNSLTIDPTTGRATTATLYQGHKDVSGTITDTELDIYIPNNVTNPPFTTTVKLEGRNSAGTTLYNRTLTGVPFASNQITHATGRLFGASATPGFTFSTADWTSTTVPF